jgi:hypothetical protein
MRKELTRVPKIPVAVSFSGINRCRNGIHTVGKSFRSHSNKCYVLAQMRGYPSVVWLTIGLMLASPLSDAHPRGGAILAVVIF